MNRVFIFDIDGTILPEPRIIKDGSWRSLGAEESVRLITEEGLNIEILPGFLEYFKTRCRHASKIYIVTGRKRSTFFGLTFMQLLPLFNLSKQIDVIFYPDKLDYKEKVYLKWKTKIIKNLIRRNPASFFYVYDDTSEYFQKFKKMSNVYLYEITHEDWWLRHFPIEEVKNV